MPELDAAPAAAPVVDEDDLGADLSRAFDAAEASTESTPDTGTASAAAPEVPASSAQPSGEARARGPDGKFIKAPEAPDAPVEAAAPVTPDFKIPEKWPEDVKAKLAAIHQVNPDHAKFLLDQYNYFRTIDGKRQAQVQGQFKAFDDLLAPGRQARALKGQDDTTYVRNLIAAGDLLDREPEKGLRWLAQTYGIDLAKLANPGEQGEEVPSHLQPLQQDVQQIKQFIASQQKHAQDAGLREAAAWIESFASQKDAAGNLLYPYFNDLVNEIYVNVQYQLNSGGQVDVAEAYRRAERMNDSVWLKKQAASSEAARKAAEAQRLRDIEDAKRASVTVSGSGARSVQAVPDDLGEHLSRVWDSQS